MKIYPSGRNERRRSRQRTASATLSADAVRDLKGPGQFECSGRCLGSEKPGFGKYVQKMGGKCVENPDVILLDKSEHMTLECS